MVGSLPLLPFSKCLCAAFGQDLVWGQEGHTHRGQKEFLHFLFGLQLDSKITSEFYSSE